MAGVKKNILYMLLVQAVTYLAPLLVLPYLTRTLGNQTYGSFGYMQAIVQYFVLITDYGFSITATRLIAMHQHDRARLSAVVANTLAAKMLLAMLCGLVSVVLCLTVGEIGLHSDILLACFIGVLGNALYPTWLFQGMEKMGVLSAITCLSRLLPLPFFFIWVQHSDDVVTAAALQNIPGIIAALFAFAYIWQSRWLEPVRLNGVSIFEMLQEGWAVFLSNISTSFYTTINGILIGMFAGKEQAAFFYATDKIRVAAQGLIQPVAAVIFPRMVVLQQAADMTGMKKLIQKGAGLLIGIQLIGGLIMFFGADLIAGLYLGPQFAGAAFYLRALAFLPTIIALATVLAQWRFQALGHSAILSKIYLLAGPLHAVYASWLTYQYHTNGLIVSLYLTESAITLMMMLMLKRKGMAILAA